MTHADTASAVRMSRDEEATASRHAEGPPPADSEKTGASSSLPYLYRQSLAPWILMRSGPLTDIVAVLRYSFNWHTGHEEFTDAKHFADALVEFAEGAEQVRLPPVGASLSTVYWRCVSLDHTRNDCAACRKHAADWMA